MSKKKVNVQKFVHDAEQGMSDPQLQEKYNLSLGELAVVKRKLRISETSANEAGESDKTTEDNSVLMKWKCPSCKMPQPVPHEVCPQCGVIVSRIRNNHPSKENQKQEEAFMQEAETHGVLGALISQNKVLLLRVLSVVIVIGIVAGGSHWIRTGIKTVKKTSSETTTKDKNASNKVAQIAPNSKIADLLEAAEIGSTDRIRELVSKGADLYASNKSGTTPLMVAGLNGHYETVEYLLDQGVDVHVTDAKGRDALKLASFNGHLAIADLLLAHGADMTTLDNKGRDALQYAGGRGHTALWRYLFERRPPGHTPTGIRVHDSETGRWLSPREYSKVSRERSRRREEAEAAQARLREQMERQKKEFEAMLRRERETAKENCKQNCYSKCNPSEWASHKCVNDCLSQCERLHRGW